MVLSRTTYELLDRLPAGVGIRPLGSHRLKDLDEPLDLFDLIVDGTGSEFAPLRYEWLIAGTRLLLAEIAWLDGDLDRSESLLQDALERGERLGGQNLLGECRQAIENLKQVRAG